MPKSGICQKFIMLIFNQINEQAKFNFLQGANNLVIISLTHFKDETTQECK